MSYIPYASREVLDNKGNLSLYSDNSQKIYTLIDGEKLFFKYPRYATQNGLGDVFTKNWWGSSDWDLHAVEKEGSYIKLITRAIHTLDITDLSADQNFFEVLSYDLQGNFIAKELPDSNNRDHDTLDKRDAKRLRKLGVDNWSTLEEWAIANQELITETDRKRDNRLEEWAYYKYKELYPNQPMLEGFGVKDAKKSNSDKPTNSNRNIL